MSYEPVPNPEANNSQLVPLKGGRYTKVMHGPPGTDIPPLHIDLEVGRDEELRVFGVSHSGWQPTDAQKVMIQAGAHIRLSVWQHPIPPLAVSVEPPVCECHDEAMVLILLGPNQVAFACRHDEDIVPLAEAPEPEPSEPGFAEAKSDFTPGDPE